MRNTPLHASLGPAESKAREGDEAKNHTDVQTRTGGNTVMAGRSGEFRNTVRAERVELAPCDRGRDVQQTLHVGMNEMVDGTHSQQSPLPSSGP